jgi:hypothetical protein
MRIYKCFLSLLLVSLLVFVNSCVSKIENEVILIPYISGIQEHSETIIIPDVSTYNSFVSEERMSEVSDGLPNALEKYNSESYYKDYYLVVIFIEFDYALPEPFISDLTLVDETLVVYLGIENTKNLSEVVTDWAILIQYPKTDVISDVSVVFPI